MRLFGLPEGPSTLRLQDLPREWEGSFKTEFSERLARRLVIELDVDDESKWGMDAYPKLLALLKAEKILSLTFAKGRFDYSYKEADPLHDGIMGWIRASRPEIAGPALAASIQEAGLPPTLVELAIPDAGLDAAATISLLPALPPGLETLDLGGNDIGIDGLRALAAARLPALTGLKLGWKGFGNAHAEALAGSSFPLLARLDLTAAPLPKAARRRLIERFGDALRLAS